MKARNMALCALFAALIALCAWVAIPAGDTVFTLQTLALFLTLGLLGGRRGSVSILVYILLGAVGLPVFTGFQGGIGALMGATGGYILGFLACGLVYWLITALGGHGRKVRLGAMIAGLCACYLFGTSWFYFGYLQAGTGMGLGLILAKCVLPYLLPDGLKLALAWYLTGRLAPYIHSY